MADLSATNNGGFIRHKQWRIYPPQTMADLSTQVGGERAGLQFRGKEQGLGIQLIERLRKQFPEK
jgi:hypothetical protein